MAYRLSEGKDDVANGDAKRHRHPVRSPQIGEMTHGRKAVTVHTVDQLAPLERLDVAARCRL